MTTTKNLPATPARAAGLILSDLKTAATTAARSVFTVGALIVELQDTYGKDADENGTVWTDPEIARELARHGMTGADGQPLSRNYVGKLAATVRVRQAALTRGIPQDEADTIARTAARLGNAKALKVRDAIAGSKARTLAGLQAAATKEIKAQTKDTGNKTGGNKGGNRGGNKTGGNKKTPSPLADLTSAIGALHTMSERLATATKADPIPAAYADEMTRALATIDAIRAHLRAVAVDPA